MPAGVAAVASAEALAGVEAVEVPVAEGVRVVSVETTTGSSVPATLGPVEPRPATAAAATSTPAHTKAAMTARRTRACR